MEYTSRAKRQLVKLEMERQGFAQIDFVMGWREVLTIMEQGAPLVFPGEAGEVAQAARRIALDCRGRVPIPKPLKGSSMCEWKATLGSHAAACER